VCPEVPPLKILVTVKLVPDTNADKRIDPATKRLVRTGVETVITVEPGILGNAQRFSCSYEGLPEDVSIGDTVLINDGAIRLEVIAVEGKEVRCRVIVGGTISDNKGINLPGTPVSIPALTPKDIEDLKFGLQHEVDYVALSFVRSADDVVRLVSEELPGQSTGLTILRGGDRRVVRVKLGARPDALATQFDALGLEVVVSARHERRDGAPGPATTAVGYHPVGIRPDTVPACTSTTATSLFPALAT